MTKQVLITAIILTLFAVTGGGLVSFTEGMTADQIKTNEKLALQFSLSTILPAKHYDNDLTSSVITLSADNLLGTTKNSLAYIARKNNKVIAIIFNAIAPNGYNGKIHLLIGVYTNGEIAGVRVVKHKETPGLGDGIEEKRSDWILSFDKHSLDSLSTKQWHVKRDGGQFDQFTGATITPRAIVKAVHNSLLYFKQHQTSFSKKLSAQPTAADTKE